MQEFVTFMSCFTCHKLLIHPNYNNAIDESSCECLLMKPPHLKSLVDHHLMIGPSVLPELPVLVQLVRDVYRIRKVTSIVDHYKRS